MEAKIDEYSEWIPETEPEQLKIVFNEMLTAAGFGILNFMEHRFQPQGWTGLWLLSESHFAVHTFPEESITYIQLSSCNRDMYQRFLQKLQQWKKDFKEV